MYVRLAFAVAAHLEPEILIVDEVLAVGDAQFQKKCLGKMGDVAKEGRTVLFVSHNMAAIQKLCPRSILLQEGRLSINGESTDVIRQYLGGTSQADGRLNTAGRWFPPKDVAIRDAWLEKGGIQTSSLLFGETADVMIEVEVKVPHVFSVELILRQADGVPVAFAPSGLAFDWEIDGTPGIITVHAQLPPAQLAIGNYSIDLILAETGVGFLDYIESAITFSVESAAIGKRNWSFSQKRGQGYELWDVMFSIRK
jgi:lipopolysaccharide transport system ATP-binding protein